MTCNNDKDSFQRIMGYNSFGERSLGTSSFGIETAATFSPFVCGLFVKFSQSFRVSKYEF